MIVENVSFTGGGTYSATSTVKFRNNTIADNIAAVRGTEGGLGGAAYVDPPTNGTYQPTYVNNVIAFNHANAGTNGGGFGGGLYVVTGANPTVRYNDLNGNIPTNVGGSKNDASYIGITGNISVNPAFVSRTAGSRHYHLLSSSGVIDVGDPAETPPTDFDGVPRPLDGDGNGTSTVDMGAFEFAPDTDSDGTPDWQDVDDDNDGSPDASDCAPLKRSVTQVPAAVGNSLRADKTGGGRLRWLRSLQGHTYNVYRGTIQRPR